MAESPRPGNQVPSSKLRKSCDSCAAIKVGCNKEKPICARCAKHGQQCVYSTARRAGRTSGGAQSRAKGVNAAAMTTPTTSTLTTAHTLDNTSNLSTPLGDGVFSPSLDIFATLSSPGDASLLSMPTNSFTELEELSASAVALLENPPNGDASTTSLFDFGLEDFSDNSSSNFTNFSGLFPGTSEANATPNSKSPTCANCGSVVARPHPDDAHVSMTTGAFQAGQSYHSESSCQCLARTLGLLAQLSPGTPGWWTLAIDNNPAPELPHFERVIAQNEQISEAIRTILQCSCSNDSYLVVILSLVVFKIIAWYTAAARAASGEDSIPGVSNSAEWQSHHNTLERVSQGLSTNGSGYDSEGEDQQRIAVQMILSKLAGVQGFVDQLSQRLPKVCDKTNGDKAMDSPVESATTPGPLAGGNALTRPFSAELARTLEADLRKRLYELSQAIVERLRRG